ncbi:MAG: nucleotide exchange factor GrpE [Micrococcales bacterium]|nr:nucleotide exchange factor GrpE [Micrococcales bacterium]MCL2667177.1 nucleotide exchange factor GrpE [Micrococcales bacterium]
MEPPTPNPKNPTFPAPDTLVDPTPTKSPGSNDFIDQIEEQIDEQIDEELANTPTPAVTVTVTAPAPVPVPASSDGSTSLLTGVLPWTLVVVLLVAAGGMAAMAFGRRNRPAPAPMVVPVAPDPSTSSVVPELITLADLITTPAAQTQVLRALRTVGVEPVDAVVGDPFDPEVHEAVATRPAEDPNQNGTIAVVHRAGWRSAHGVVRPAGVEVWMVDATDGV